MNTSLIIRSKIIASKKAILMLLAISMRGTVTELRKVKENKPLQQNDRKS